MDPVDDLHGNDTKLCGDAGRNEGESDRAVCISPQKRKGPWKSEESEEENLNKETVVLLNLESICQSRASINVVSWGVAFEWFDVVYSGRIFCKTS